MLCDQHWNDPIFVYQKFFKKLVKFTIFSQECVNDTSSTSIFLFNFHIELYSPVDPFKLSPSYLYQKIPHLIKKKLREGKEDKLEVIAEC